MIEQLFENVLRLPSVRSLVDEAVDNLLRGQSHLLLRPSAFARPVVSEAVFSELQKRRVNVETLDVRKVDAKRLPHSLREYYHLAISSELQSSLDYVMHTLADIEVIQLSGMDALLPEDQSRWLALALVWGRTSQVREDRGLRSPALFGDLTLDESMLMHVETDLRLDVAWWWGRPSALELRLACRLTDRDVADRSSGQWREHLTVSLASSDLEFAAMVWPLATEPTMVLRKAIGEYARERGWHGAAFRRAIEPLIPNLRMAQTASYAAGIGEIEPPGPLRGLWNQGIAHYTPEHGCELHTAALATLDDPAALDSRLWRGQASLVLPWLDSVRRHVCRYLTVKHGNSWPVRWCTPESHDEREELKTSPNACQWGYLHHLISCVPQLQCERAKLSTVTASGRDLRNELAHGRTVEYEEFARFLRESEQASVQST